MLRATRLIVQVILLFIRQLLYKPVGALLPLHLDPRQPDAVHLLSQPKFVLTARMRQAAVW
jgi:hypothetical protein